MFSGCATLLKGYEDSVRLNYTSDSLKVFTKEGVEIPINKKLVEGGYGTYYVNEIKLRSNEVHILTLKNQNRVKTITLYPKLGFGWVFLDLVCGVLPSFYDAYTGNWNRFSDINASMEAK